MSARPISRVGFTIIAAAALTLAGCNNAADDQAAKVSSAASSAMESASTDASAAMSDAKVQLMDGFVKAKPADKAMTAVFGTITNNSDKEITIESFTTSLENVGKYEIHETVDGKMRMKEKGIAIPAGGTFELKPGGDHLMIMDIATPIEAGDTIDLTLKTADGQSIEITDLPVRTIGSGEEDYSQDGGVEGNTGMSPQETPTDGHDHNHEHGDGHGQNH